MSVLFADTFTRGDNDALGANWTEINGNWQIATNKLQVETQVSTPPTVVLTTSSAHAAVADVKVTVTQASATGDGGPVARWTGGDVTSHGYACDVFSNSCDINRYDTSEIGVLLRTASITQVADGVIALEVSGTGAAVTLKQYYQGTQRGADYVDSSANRITTADRTGVHNFGTAPQDYDDFQVEDPTRRFLMGSH